MKNKKPVLIVCLIVFLLGACSSRSTTSSSSSSALESNIHQTALSGLANKNMRTDNSKEELNESQKGVRTGNTQNSDCQTEINALKTNQPTHIFTKNNGQTVTLSFTGVPTYRDMWWDNKENFIQVEYLSYIYHATEPNNFLAYRRELYLNKSTCQTDYIRLREYHHVGAQDNYTHLYDHETLYDAEGNTILSFNCDDSGECTETNSTYESQIRQTENNNISYETIDGIISIVSGSSTSSTMTGTVWYPNSQNPAHTVSFSNASMEITINDYQACNFDVNLTFPIQITTNQISGSELVYTGHLEGDPNIEMGPCLKNSSLYADLYNNGQKVARMLLSSDDEMTFYLYENGVLSTTPISSN